jgi:hypothetical protein
MHLRGPSFTVSLFLALACQPSDGEDSGSISTVDSSSSECLDSDNQLRLAWPLAGSDAHDWVTSNYVDLDPGPDMEDYTGHTGSEAKTYDGHQGVDIGISSFRAMDTGIPVYAAVSGQVELVINDFDDRNTACENFDANLVSIRHASGHIVQYVHLRKASIPLQVGDTVQAGDLIGEIGSSGCSDAPHLHLQIMTPAGEVIDPFLDDLWCSPPVYDTPLSFMEAWLLEGPAKLYENPGQDPPEETTALSVGSTLLTYAVVAGGLPGEDLGVVLEGPDGSTLGPWPFVFEESWQLSTWVWSFTTKGPPGEWTARYLINGESVSEKPFTLQ